MLPTPNTTHPAPSPNAPKAPNAEPYLAALIIADGKVKLAAENLGITPAELVMEIARDPESQRAIDQYLRLYSTLKAFQMIGEAQMQLHATVHELEGNQAARHFTTLLTVIENFTKRSPASTQNINLFESALKHMPPEVADALRLLKTEDTLSDEDYANRVINGNASLLEDSEA